MAMKVAIIGSGNIGTDLMIKMMRNADELEMAALVGMDPEVGRAGAGRALGVATTHAGHRRPACAMPVYPGYRHRVRCHIGRRAHAP